MELEEVSGFVTCSYNSEWWLGCVLETHTEEVQVSLTLLHPPGPSRSYKYPDVPVIVTLPLTEILIKVCPRSPTGHVYTLIQKEIKTTVEKLETRTPEPFVSIARFILSTYSLLCLCQCASVYLPYLA